MRTGPLTLRHLLLWLGLFGVYAATLGVPATGTSRFTADEAHTLLTARAIVEDHAPDLRRQYATRGYREFWPGVLHPRGQGTGGRIDEPQGVGTALLVAPAYALGGPTAVQLFLAALAALAWVAAAALARRLVPEPWATAAPLACALSPPALAYATAVRPEMPAALLLATAALVALKIRDRPRLRLATAAGALVAPLPWLSPFYLLPGAVVGAMMVRWLMRRERRLAALVGGEVVFTSLVVWISVNDRLYGGLTPFAAQSRGEHPTGTESLSGYAARLPRLLGLWIDRDHGLLRWAPVFALAGVAVWLLWRSRREAIVRAVPGQLDVEVTAGLLAGVCAAEVLVALLAPATSGPWFPTRFLVPALPVAAALSAWGLRHAPRAGLALIALTVGASGWLFAALRLGEASWAHPALGGPWGGAERALPSFATASAQTLAFSIAIAALAAAVAGREWWRRRPAPPVAV